MVSISENINTDALRSAIEAVEDNNRINGGSWSSWDGASHVEEAYGVDLCREGKAVIQRAIETDGRSLLEDLPAVELAAWGQNFSGSFWSQGCA